MYRKLKFYLSLSCLLCLLALCSSVSAKPEAEKPVPKKVVKIKKPKKPVEAKKFNLGLECVSVKREFKSGKPAKMTFRLRNYEMRLLSIPEWMIEESNNIRLYYVPWEEKMKKPDKDQWKAIIPNVGESPKRMTLELAPRNSVLLDVVLPFVEKMNIDSPQDFILYVKLNLSSVSARSKFIKITVKPSPR